MDRLIVDGYNVIFAWPGLAALKDVKPEDARDMLVAILADFAAMTPPRRDGGVRFAPPPRH